MRKNKISFLGLVLLVAALAAFLTACGDDNDNGHGMHGGAGGDGNTRVTLSAIATVNVGNTLALTATVTPASAGNLTWASSNTAIATVSNTGVVTGISLGTATITAQTDCNVIAAIDVIIVPPGVQIDTVSFNSGGGSLIGNATVIRGATFPEPVAPIRAGFIFKGWYKEATFVNPWNFTTNTVTGNITLFARWLVKVQIQMELIPAANSTFFMGDHRIAQRQVTLTNDFLMGRYPVTRGQWYEIMGTTPWTVSGLGHWTAHGHPRLPASNVSWFGAIEFANRLSIMHGLDPVYKIEPVGGGIPTANPDYWGSVDARWNLVHVRTDIANPNGYRLPTEAQWEFAARAGTNADFHNGVNWVSSAATGPSVWPIAWFNWNAHGHGGHPSEVGIGRRVQYPGTGQFGYLLQRRDSNIWGLYDMHGNVDEWVWDRWTVTATLLADTPATDPVGNINTNEPHRVRRGGAFNSSGGLIRSWSRGSMTQGGHASTVGFRLIRHP